MDILSKFVNLARTPEQIQDSAIEMQNPAAAAAPRYPYGTCVSFDQETLDRLDLDSNAEVGDEVEFTCRGKITAISKRDTDKGPDARVEIQITDIALGDEHEEQEEKKLPPYKKAFHHEE